MGFLDIFRRKHAEPTQEGAAVAAQPKNAPEMMRQMRLGWLDIKRGDQTVAVSSAVMDWPLDGNVVTVCASSLGDGSVYTTGTFGILGGIGHEAVRTAAKNFIQAAEKCLQVTIPTTDFSYSGPGWIKFFFVTPSCVRSISFAVGDTQKEGSPARFLYAHGQQVLTELRVVGERAKEQK
jgi:hypothetical protein